MKKRLLAALLCVIMVMALLPATAFASPGDIFEYVTADTIPVTVKLLVDTDPSGSTPGTVFVGNGSEAAIGTDVTSLTLPEEIVRPGTGERYKVTRIQLYAFQGCTNLQSVSLSGVTYIAANAFEDCPNLKTLNLASATSIPNDMFTGRSNLETLNLASITTIGFSMFAGCTNLKTLNLASATTVVAAAFENCCNLETLNLPEATTIGEKAFLDCERLQSITLPKVTQIGNYAFAGCVALESVTIWNASAAASWNDTILRTASGNVTLYVPNGSVAAVSPLVGGTNKVVGLWAVSGTVYDEDGNAAANATVSVYDISTKTDPSGAYTVYVKPGDSTPAVITANIEGAGEKSFSVSNVTADLTYKDIYFGDNATSVWIWGQELKNTSRYYHNGANGTQGTADNSDAGCNAYFNAATGTLTLNGLNVKDSTATKTTGTNNFTYAIYAEGDLTINVTGGSEVSTDPAAAGNTNIALCVKGDLTFSGDGFELNAFAEKGASTFGIYILGDLEVSSGMLNGHAGRLAGDAATPDAKSFGVSAMGAITVSGGNLIGISEGAKAINNSISAGIGAGDVTLSGGEIRASGSTSDAAYAMSYGLYAESLDIQGGTATAAAIEGTAIGGNNGSFSAGAAVRGDISVSGGSFTAEGGEATATGEARSHSYGIYAEADSIDFSGGTVNATGGEAGYESCGIKNAGNRNNTGDYIDGGAIAVSGTADVTANDGAAQFCYGLAAFADITVTGGTIEGIANGTPKGAGNNGVYVLNGAVTVSGGSMTGTAAGGGNFSYGLVVEGGSVTVSGGSMTATAAAAIHFSYGVNASGNISVTGGTLTAKSGSATNASALNKKLTLGTGLTAKGSTSSDGSFPENYVGTNNSSYMWVFVTPTPTVTSVAVNPASVSIEKGGTQTFNATVVGRNNPAQTVTWSVSDNNSANTKINSSGVLTVGRNETATTLTVRATSTQNNAISGTAMVTVTSPPTPSVPGGGYTPSPVTVYNDPSVSNATIWLTGSGLTATDQLVTQRNPYGSAYRALLKLADSDDVFNTYNIYLNSGKKSTGYAMHLTFDLNSKYAGQDFTLVHQKANGTYEYFYDTADANGDLTFGPLYELSPFMLVKGTLARDHASDAVIVPDTGDSSAPVFWPGVTLIALLVLWAAACIIKRKRA